MSTTELCQATVLHVTQAEADLLLKRLARATFLHNRGIEVYSVPMTEPFVLADGSKREGAVIMVRAETDRACGMGVGFVHAISEGLTG